MFGFYKKGFSLLELVVTIGFLGIVVAAFISVVNPLDKAKGARDQRLLENAALVSEAIEKFYISKGRMPWAGEGESLSLAWTRLTVPKVGVCGDKDCSEAGELVESGNLPQDFLLQDSLEREEDAIFLARGEEKQDPIYICFAPQSEQMRGNTGNLYRLKEGVLLNPSGIPENCPSSVTWSGEDACFVCLN